MAQNSIPSAAFVLELPNATAGYSAAVLGKHGTTVATARKSTIWRQRRQGFHPSKSELQNANSEFPGIFSSPNSPRMLKIKVLLRDRVPFHRRVGGSTKPCHPCLPSLSGAQAHAQAEAEFCSPGSPPLRFRHGVVPLPIRFHLSPVPSFLLNGSLRFSILTTPL